MATLAVVPARAATVAPLYDIEDHLAALIETAELVPAEQEAEFQQELARSIEAAVEKRDRVGQFLAHCEAQAALAKAEIERLRERKAIYERAVERVESYVVKTIECLGADTKGKYRKLEGRTVTLSIRGCPASADITNEAAVPAAYKTLTVKVPAAAWDQILDSLEVDLRLTILEQARVTDTSVSKTAVKAALESGEQVAGARLITDKHSLRRT